MSDTRTDLPAVGSSNFLTRVREVLQTYMGRQGNQMNRGLTVGDLVDAGLVGLKPGHALRPGGTLPLLPGSSVESAYEPDLTPPPTPTGFAATAAISNMLVEHDAPIYTAGHGHLRTRLYGATWNSGALPVFTDAVELAQFSGTVHAYATNPATTWHLWAKWESKDGVLSASPAGGTNGFVVTTAQDVAKLLEALTGQITESQLYTSLGARIDLLDAGGADTTQLPYSLVAIAAAQDALNQRVAHDLDTIGTDLLTNAASINTTAGLVTGAGIYVDPGTGEVKISGLEATKTTLSTVDARLSAAETSITLKATKTYVDNLVATAVIDPTQIPVFDTLESRITSAELDIDGLNSEVALKASTLSLDATNVRMTTAENNISALTGTVATKVDSSTFTATTGGLDARLGSAESTLTSLGDVSSITNVVQQSNRRHIQDNQDGETLLRNVLNTQQETDLRSQEVALARSDLTASIESGLSAEATARLLLAAEVADNTAAIDTESTARATEYASMAIQIATLRATVDGNTAAISTEASARATQTGDLYAQYTVKTDVAGLVSGYGLASTANNAAPSSMFGVRANSFFVAPPATASATAPTDDLYDGFTWLDTSVTPNVTRYRSGATWVTTPPVLPFVVQATPTTVNGVAVPAGVYMMSAFIKNGDIVNAKIGNLAVDDAKIANMSVDKLTAGSLSVGQYAQSTGYVAGSSGWRINGDGTAEFSAVVVRGTVFASQGEIGGWTIGSSYLQSNTYILGESGTRLNSDGTGQIGGITITQTGIEANFSQGLNGFRFSKTGQIEAYNANGTFKFNTSATGSASIIKVGDWFDLRANGDFTTNGLIQSLDGRNFINPKAVGSQPFILVRDSSYNVKVRITADGDAYFTNSIASGTWTGDVQLIQDLGGSYSTPWVEIMIDTGIRRPWGSFGDRTLSARIGNFSGIYSASESAGNYVGLIDMDASVVWRRPVFSVPAPVYDNGQNPYGFNNEAVFIKVMVRLADRDNKATHRLNSLQWTLDTIA